MCSIANFKNSVFYVLDGLIRIHFSTSWCRYEMYSFKFLVERLKNEENVGMWNFSCRDGR